MNKKDFCGSGSGSRAPTYEKQYEYMVCGNNMKVEKCSLFNLFEMDSMLLSRVWALDPGPCLRSHICFHTPGHIVFMPFSYSSKTSFFSLSIRTMSTTDEDVACGHSRFPLTMLFYLGGSEDGYGQQSEPVEITRALTRISPVSKLTVRTGPPDQGYTKI